MLQKKIHIHFKETSSKSEQLFIYMNKKEKKISC